MLSAYIRRDFAGLGVYRSYLDTARVGLMPFTVRDEAVSSLLEYLTDPLGKVADVAWKYEYLRKRLSRLIPAPGPENVTLMGSTTSCIVRTAASAMLYLSRETGEPVPIITTIHEYPGVLRALHSLCRSMPHACSGIHLAGSPGIASWEEEVVELAEKGPSIVVASSIAWVTGYLADLERVASKTRSSGGFLIVDAAQQLGQAVVDYNGIGVDIACGTSKKWLLNPLSNIGIAYVSERASRIEPYIVGSHNVESSPLDLCDPSGPNLSYRLLPDADRFMSISRPSLFSIDMAIGVVEYLLGISPHAIRDHIIALVRLAEDLAGEKGFSVALDGVSYDRRSGIVLVDMGLSPAKHFEACRRLSKRGIAVSCRGQAGYAGLRVSIHLYNNEDDVRVFFEEASREAKRLGAD